MEKLTHRGRDQRELPGGDIEEKIFVLINKIIDLLAKTKSDKTKQTLLGTLKRATDTLEKFLREKHQQEQQQCQFQIVVRVPGERWGR